MKRIYALCCMLTITPAFATVYTTNITDGCGDYGLLNATWTPNQYTCQSGEFLPANTPGCQTCPSGYACTGGVYAFNETDSQGAVDNDNRIVQNEAKVCATNFAHLLNAAWTPNQYTCNSGNYLPANSITCSACPSGYTCNGGTFTFNETVNQYACGAGYFSPANTVGCITCPSGYTCAGGTYAVNETKAQGLVVDDSVIELTETKMCASNSVHILNATWTRNQHTCAAGYYMPANYDGCTLCPVNSYCGGGTYTFNETLTQGIVSCASGLFAPTGMWESAQCGRILHVGDSVLYLRSVKKTVPSVNVDIDNDGVADFFGNMTTLDVPMTNGTQRKLKLQYGGQTYSVYDDSVDLGE